MKHIFIMLLVSLSVLVNGQEIDGKPLDTIVANDILINHTYKLYTSKNHLSTLFKNADSTTHRIAEMTYYCDTYSVLYYKKSIITVCDSSGLVQFDLYDNAFSVSIKGQKIYIGESDAILKQMFPKSYLIKDYMGDEGTFKGLTSVRVYFRYGQYLIFKINKQNKITEISIWEDDA